MSDAKNKSRDNRLVVQLLATTPFAFCGRFGLGRYVLSLAFWLAATVGIWLATATPSSALGPLETSGNGRWIVFASRQDVDEAIGLARRFGSDFGAPTVLTTTNGWYAVAAGPVAVPDVATFKKRLSDAWWAPKDTFLTNGQTLSRRCGNARSLRSSRQRRTRNTGRVSRRRRAWRRGSSPSKGARSSASAAAAGTLCPLLSMTTGPTIRPGHRSRGWTHPLPFRRWSRRTSRAGRIAALS